MRATSRDDGFTLIEVLVTVALLGAAMAIAVAGFSRYSSAHEQQGTARSLQSALRDAQQRAVTEGRAMCVQFADTSYTVWRTSCDPATGVKVAGPVATESADVHIDIAASETLTFTPRGTATWSSIETDPLQESCGHVTALRFTVSRDGSDKTYALCVVHLTGRVDLDG